MAIVQFPIERLGSAERVALRRGVARNGAAGPSLRLIGTGEPGPTFCANCAAPVDYGAVWRGSEAFCSVECSLGGNRPA